MSCGSDCDPRIGLDPIRSTTVRSPEFCDSVSPESESDPEPGNRCAKAPDFSPELLWTDPESGATQSESDPELDPWPSKISGLSAELAPD